MASPADAIAFAAQAGLDQAAIFEIVYWLRTGETPDQATEGTRAFINQLGDMGLSSTGVSQLDYYLSNGRPPEDLSYVDERDQVMGLVPAEAPVTQAPSTPASGSSAAERSAKAVLADITRQWGLEGVADQVWNAYLNGTPESGLPQVIRQTDQYKTRFAGMAQLQAKGRAISEGEYITLERQYAQIMQSAGLPKGLFDDPSDFAKLIGGEVAPTEFASRLDTYNEALYQAPAEVRDELSRLYGVTEGQMLAYFIDPDRTQQQIQTQFQASRKSAAAVRSGFGGLTMGEAEGIAKLGVSDEQAQAGFGALAGSRGLMEVGEAGESAIGRSDQLAATFGGNANAQRRIEKKKAKRLANFEGGGGYARSETGMSGVGSAG